MPITRSFAKVRTDAVGDEDENTDSEINNLDNQTKPLKQVSENLQFDVDDASCSGSYSSLRNKTSLPSNTHRLGYLKAQLRERQLKEELELENKILENKRRLLEAKNLVEMARLELEGEGDDVSCDKENQVSCAVPRDDVPEDRKTQALISNDYHLCPTYERSSLKANVAPSLPMSGIQLPRVELMSFDGEPAMFWKFMRQFDTYLGDKLDDDGQRFLYLLHYCRGRARAAIEECIILPPETAYHRARNILGELFGNPRIVVRSVIDKLLSSTVRIYNNPDSLADLSIRMQSCELTLAQISKESELNCSGVMDKIVSMLPLDLQNKWAELVDSHELSGCETKFSDLATFIAGRSRIARRQFGSMTSHNRSYNERFIKEFDRQMIPKKSTFMSTQKTFAIRSCLHCQKDHNLDSCPQFEQLDVSRRWDRIRELGACFICFRTNHQARNCYTGRRCRQVGCNARHHELLHSIDVNKVPEVSTSNVNATNTSSSKILLGVIPVILEGPFGQIKTYALLDNGSDTSLMCKEVMDQLGVEHDAARLNLTTVNSSIDVECSTGQLKVRSLDGQEEIIIEKVYSVNKLPIRAPDMPIQRTIEKWSYLRGCEFEELSGAQVSLLIGCDVPEAHWVLEQRIGGRRQPFAVRTLLGWVLYGPVCNNVENVHVNCMSTEQISISDQLRNMYNSEFSDVDSLQNNLSIKEKVALDLVSRETIWKDGHFEIPLPWNGQERKLSDNYIYAKRRLEHIRTKFYRDDALFKRYAEVIRQYRDKGYIVKVNENQLLPEPSTKWYLPHHPVLNPKKPEKLRIVFDFAARFNGMSLNDCLYQGPDMTVGLIGVLLRFRLDKIALVSDIEEMFLQIRTPLKDRGALRFLWWSEDDYMRPIEEYQLTVHPFGATSSPFCANFALRKTLEQFGGECSNSVKNSIHRNFYVDDCLVSLPNLTEAIEFVKQLPEILMKGGFRLRKWMSNERQVLESIPEKDRAQAVININSCSLPIERTLGIDWDAEKDVLRFQFNIPDKPITRRGILSCISSLFDPLGIVGPLILPVKCLLQELCRRGLDWDATIEEGDRKFWERWRSYINGIGELCVPRCIKTTGYDESPQLHIFCDACEKGYGAVAYVRFTNDSGYGRSRIVFAKSRVAPLKVITIPRLELSSAVLATRVYQIIKKELPFEFESVWFWTDSMIVLHYINNTSSKFSTFVANRLSIIHEHTRTLQWRHVKSELNPADYASRGFNFKQCELDIWFEGPIFLKAPENIWPSWKSMQPLNYDLEFKREAKVLCSSVTPGVLSNLLYHYSDWFKLLKAVAWMTRFKRYLSIMFGRSRDTNLTLGPLKMEEIESARFDVIRLVQSEAFADELIILRGAEDNATSRRHVTPIINRFRKLSPILVDGIIRAGGRLQRSNYTTDFVHPIILPKEHHVTKLIVRHYHQLEGHTGVSHILAAMRKQYWILKGGSTVKSIIRQCVLCRRYQGSLGQQMMASLPPVRIERGWFPFENVGVDYFGPIAVKKNRHLEKRYGCVFSCLQCRAVHIEVAHSLSTDSFIMSLMRFVGRRGKPKHIYSDNGSNFIGAEAELKRCLHEWSQRTISDRMNIIGINWHFQPPGASHRGGVWERMIRSIKRILYSISHGQVMTDESLQTFLAEVERILNNRPLVPMYADVDEPDVLKPNHLLLMRSCEPVVPECPQESILSRRWRQVNYLATVFWNRWIKEYLPILQIRQKWFDRCPNFRKGDIVLVASENTKRNHWPMGVIEDCQEDTDGLVRTVSVRLAGGIVERDIRKLCLLERVGEPEL